MSDQAGAAATLDPNLSNAVYDATGKLLLTVSVPASPTSTEPGAPTGQVLNLAGDSFPSRFWMLNGAQPAGIVGGGTIEAFDVSFSTTTSGGGGYGYGYGSAPAAAVTVTKVHASHAGTLLGADGKTLLIPGLWGLAFSPVTGDLFFTAGPDDENHGLFGKLTVAP